MEQNKANSLHHLSIRLVGESHSKLAYLDYMLKNIFSCVSVLHSHVVTDTVIIHS